MVFSGRQAHVFQDQTIATIVPILIDLILREFLTRDGNKVRHL